MTRVSRWRATGGSSGKGWMAKAAEWLSGPLALGTASVCEGGGGADTGAAWAEEERDVGSEEAGTELGLGGCRGSMVAAAALLLADMAAKANENARLVDQARNTIDGRWKLHTIPTEGCWGDKPEREGDKPERKESRFVD